MDLDYVSPDPTHKIGEALIEIGFKKEGQFRHYENEDCPFFVEFPPGPIAVGDELITKDFNDIKGIVLLNSTDCVKDRLAAFYHWDDDQSLEQAVLVAKAQKVDLQEIERWSKNENSMKQFNKFKELLEK